MMWFTAVCSVAGVGVGVGDGVGVAVGPPAETPPQPESESKQTKQTRRHNSFFIEDPTTINHCDVVSRAAGCPELLNMNLKTN
jgi:hypothetical protein